MDAPLVIILEMVKVIFSNTIGTLVNLVGLFGSLTQSLAFIGGMSALGFFLAAIVLGAVLFFLGKFFLKSWKLLAVLFVAGLIIIWILAIGAG